MRSLHACALIPSLSRSGGLPLQMKPRRTKGPPVLTVADMHKTHICGTPILENNREGAAGMRSLHACALIPSLSRPGGLPLQMKPRRTKGPPVLTVADMHKTHICGTPITENNRVGAAGMRSLHACALIPSLSRPGGPPLQMKPRRTKGPPVLTVADMHKTHICGTPVLASADMHKTHICGTPVLENNREGAAGMRSLHACALVPSLSGGLPLQMKPRRTKCPQSSPSQTCTIRISAAPPSWKIIVRVPQACALCMPAPWSRAYRVPRVYDCR